MVGQGQGRHGRVRRRRVRPRAAVAGSSATGVVAAGSAVVPAGRSSPGAPPDAAVRRHPAPFAGARAGAFAGVQRHRRRRIALGDLRRQRRRPLQPLGPAAPAVGHRERQVGAGRDGAQRHRRLPALLATAQHAQRAGRGVRDQHLAGGQLGDRQAGDRRCARRRRARRRCARRRRACALIVAAASAQVAVVGGQVEPYPGAAQARAQLRHGDRVYGPLRRTERGRHAGGEAGLRAGPHHPKRAGRQMISAQAAARHQQVGGAARAHGAQRDLVGRALHRDAGAGALRHRGPMVIGVVGTDRHPVGEAASGQEVAGAQQVDRLHPPAFADADVRRHPRQAVVGVARAAIAVRLQVVDDPRHLPPAGLLRRRQRRPVGGVVADHLHLHGHVVAVRDDRDHRHLIVIPVGRAAGRQHRRHRRAAVDQSEVEAHRQLQPAGRLVDRRRVAGHQHRSALAERPAAARHQVGVAGGVHGDRRLDAGQAALVGQHHGGHAVTGPLHGQRLGVQQQLHARLGKHLLQHELEALAVEGAPVAVGLVGGDAAEGVEPAYHLAPAVVHDAGLSAEGMDAAGGPLTADEAVLLDQQHARAVIRRAERRVHSGHAAAGDQHVGPAPFAERQRHAVVDRSAHRIRFRFSYRGRGSSNGSALLRRPPTRLPGLTRETCDNTVSIPICT